MEEDEEEEEEEEEEREEGEEEKEEEEVAGKIEAQHECTLIGTAHSEQSTSKELEKV